MVHGAVGYLIRHDRPERRSEKTPDQGPDFIIAAQIISLINHVPSPHRFFNTSPQPGTRKRP
jgi:hypothetical protein